MIEVVKLGPARQNTVTFQSLSRRRSISGLPPVVAILS